MNSNKGPELRCKRHSKTERAEPKDMVYRSEICRKIRIQNKNLKYPAWFRKNVRSVLYYATIIKSGQYISKTKHSAYTGH